MVIRVSSAGEIRGLIEAMHSSDDVAREAAVARLSVIGSRAIPHLLNAYRIASNRSVRLALLRAMEPIGDPRAAGPAADAIAEGGDVGVAAVAVLRGLVESAGGRTAPDALERLVATALDASRERRVRIAAIQALAGMGDAVRQRLAPALIDDPDPAIRSHASPSGTPAGDATAIWRDALDGHLPDDPAVLSEVLSEQGSAAPLSEVQTLVDRIRAREEQCTGAAAASWRAVRGSLHQLLALRDSRVALYDLRESVERATDELPPAFLAAIQSLGDASCLDAIAAAYTRSASQDRRWHQMLGTAFRAIASREKITRRHAVMKRIAARWPDARRALWDVKPRGSNSL